MKPVFAQRGATTLAITLILLAIVTAMVLFSASVGYFEQRTATNSNRAQIAERSAEYALSLAGEYLKANRNRLISDETTDGGWFASGTEHWAKCADVASPGSGHPCLSERDATRRAQLYFWTSDGTTAGSRDIPYTSVIPTAGQVESGVGGDADFAASTSVGALLCRLDTTDLSNVHCALEPVSGNRIAMTLVAQATLTGEGAESTVKEAWATYNSFVPSAAVPLVASGLVKGLGNAQIVAAPNAGGFGLPGSIWSPRDADVDTNGSVTTCHIGDFLKGTPENQLKTTCATTDDCSCNGGASNEFLSGHIGPLKREAEDIIDIDGGPAAGIGVLPDITFFPGKDKNGVQLDKSTDDTDDSLFEFTFNVDYVATEADVGVTQSTCGDTGAQNCVDYAMREEFDAKVVSACTDLTASSSGIIYIPTGCSSLPNGTIGSPENPVIVVMDQSGGGSPVELQLNSNTIFYGMLFVHSDESNAQVKGNGDIKIFGAIVVEGDVEISGNITVVYDDTSVSGDTHKLPASARFGRVAGAWLDARTAF